MAFFNSTQSTSVDPATANRQQYTWDQGVNLYNQPYTPYGGQLVQGLSQDQLDANAMVRQGVANNVGAGYLNQAGQAATAAAGYQPQMMNPSQGLGIGYMGAYQNPWTTDVINASMADLNRSRQMAVGSGEDAAIRGGAYGGSRHGVADSLTNDAYLRNAGQMAAGLRSQGFNTAAQLGQQDAGRYMNTLQANQQAGLAGANLGLSAGNALAGLSDTERQQYFQNSAALDTIGGGLQKQGQTELNSAYEQWLKSQNYPYQQYQTLTGANAAAGRTGTTATTDQATASKIGYSLNALGQLVPVISGMFKP